MRIPCTGSFCFNSNHTTMTIRYILNAARNSVPPSPRCKRILSRIEEITWCAGYCEPGYTTPEKGICFANWNTVREHKEKETPGDDIPKRLYDILTKHGVECEWSDEWSTCADCNKAFRTSPDSYGWTPHYKVIDECELVCLDCAPASEATE